MNLMVAENMVERWKAMTRRSAAIVGAEITAPLLPVPLDEIVGHHFH